MSTAPDSAPSATQPAALRNEQGLRKIAARTRAIAWLMEALAAAVGLAVAYSLISSRVDASVGHAEILIAAGDADAATAAAEDAVERTEAHGALWWMPEALRIKGEALLVSGTKNHADAEKHFHRSLDLARGQGALSWELRAATSLARLLRDQGRSADAIARLQPIYGRFTEGFNTADLIAAKQLLEALADADRR